MELASEQILPVSKVVAWDALNDIEMLKGCIPGCDSIVSIGANEYEVGLTAAVGPVKARFKGKLRLDDIVPPHHYTIYFEGQGGAAGHGKGSAAVSLESIDPSSTKLLYKATAQVGGRLAQVGSRLVDMAAQKMATEFFANFERLLLELPASAAATQKSAAVTSSNLAQPSSSLAGRLINWLKALFR